MNIPSATTEMLRQSPLVAGVTWLNAFASSYGTVTIFGLALLYAGMQMVFRWKEHRAIMRKNHVQDSGN